MPARLLEEPRMEPLRQSSGNEFSLCAPGIHIPLESIAGGSGLDDSLEK
jgi:hypothetical protein